MCSDAGPSGHPTLVAGAWESVRVLDELVDLHAGIDAATLGFLAGHAAAWADRGLGNPDLYARAITYTARPSKRLRPMLYALARQACVPSAPLVDPPMLAVASALEIAHSAILIHDDVIDGDPERSGVTAIHEAARGSSGQAHGTAVAVFTGDCLAALASLPILRSSMSARLKVELLAELQAQTVRTSEGQLVELHLLDRAPLESLSRESIERAYAAKTAPTCVELPLCLGAISSGMDARTIAALRGASDGVGVALQILNDLVRYERIIQGRCVRPIDARSVAFLLRVAWEAASPLGRADLQALFAGGASDPEQIARCLRDSTAPQELRDIVASLFTKARCHITAAVADTDLAGRLTNLIDFLAILYQPGSALWHGIGRYPRDAHPYPRGSADG